MSGRLIRLPGPALVTLVGAAFLLPLSSWAQCGSADLLAVHRLWRIGFNEVEVLAGTQVLGDYWQNWDTSVQSTERINGEFLHSGSDSTQGNRSAVQWNDAPSSAGTGTYTTSNVHLASCAGFSSTNVSSDSLVVLSPEIDNLPYNSALWYFGPGTPGAVPVAGGYAYQYADLAFNKNCGVDDTCTGTVSWSEIDPLGQISVSSNGYLKSMGGGSSCTYESAVQAGLNGWTLTYPIFVNSPNSLIHPKAEETLPLGAGYQTRKYWAVVDACLMSVPSVALHEVFGTFGNPGVVSGWPDPAATGASGYNYTNYIFFDTIGANGASYDPSTTYTSSTPPYAYNTRLKYAAQKWYIGSQTAASGRQVFNGTIEYFRDHGNSR